MMNPTGRRPSVGVLCGTVLLACAFAGPHAGGAAFEVDSAGAPVRAVAEIGLTVADLDRSVAFFTDVLTFEKLTEAEVSGDGFARLQGLPPDTKARTARLRLGDEVVGLTQFVTPPGRRFPADTRSNDRWFQHFAIVVRDMERAHARLVQHGVRAASRGGPQRLPDWNRNAAGIKAFYFRDPDGHFLEILQFPPGKGDPKWHGSTDRGMGSGDQGTKIRDRNQGDRSKESRTADTALAGGPLFLGIDHTAIVVADTEASLRFYCGRLGFRVVGGSENHGIEQENLNNVGGAHLRITTLRTATGPAIELLEYLNPRDGRPYPADAHSNDLLHWQTTLVARDAAGLAAILRSERARFVSASAENARREAPEDCGAFIVRDPDGHALRIIGP
ncbi:MAG: VOC family protein [Phycisphaerae bacterium]